MMKPNIALVGSNSLMLSGLKSLLESIVPFAEITVYNNVIQLREDNSIVFFHYFVTPSAFCEDTGFFSKLKHQTIVLSDGENEDLIPCDFRRMDMLVPFDRLTKQLLVFQQFAHHGYSHYPSSVVGKLREEDANSKEVLTKREIEVLSLLAKGLINKEIADKLNISLNTVITHRKNIMVKLKSQSLSRLVIYAVQHGYIDVDEIR